LAEYVLAKVWENLDHSGFGENTASTIAVLSWNGKIGYVHTPAQRLGGCGDALANPGRIGGNLTTGKFSKDTWPGLASV